MAKRVNRRKVYAQAAREIGPSMFSCSVVKAIDKCVGAEYSRDLLQAVTRVLYEGDNLAFLARLRGFNDEPHTEELRKRLLRQAAAGHKERWHKTLTDFARKTGAIR